MTASHPNISKGGRDVYNTVAIKPSPFGVCEVAGTGTVPDADARGFYEAADDFMVGRPWTWLKGTRHRQFGLVLLDSTEESGGGEGTERREDGGDGDDPSGALDVVELRGLTSDAGRELNGLRGEVVPGGGGGEGGDQRFRVRLFRSGRVVAARSDRVVVVRRHDPQRNFVIKVSGADGASYKVDVYGSWAALHQHCGQTHAWGDSPPPGGPDPRGTFCVTVEYVGRDEAAKHFKKELAYRRRLGLGKPPGRGDLAVVHGLSLDGRRITQAELRAAEAGLRAAVEFVPMLAERPVPPPPYYLPLTFDEREESLAFRGGAVRALCSFPAGNLAPEFWPWRSYPQIVQRFAPRPTSVRTVEQAVKYHEAELAKAGADYERIRSDARRGNFHAFAHKFGLANALWEAETEPSVREALSIGRTLLDIVLEVDPSDKNGKVRHFVLNLSLEVGRWDDAAELLARFPEDACEESLWTAVLIYFKSRGPDSKTTRRALTNAVKFNRSVYPLLVGDRLLEEGELERCRSRGCEYFCLDGRWFGQPENAPVYFHNYSKYFFQDPEIVTWLKDQRGALKPILDGEAESGSTVEQNFAAAAEGDIGVKTRSAKGTVSKVNADKICCANCGSIGKLWKCSGCQEVSYCNRQCQLDHRKEHKAACRKHREKDKGKEKVEEFAAQEKEATGHPSWARLNVETRQNLLKFHQEEGWRPWPVTVETPAMLNHPLYSFLTAHPDMRFSARVEDPPHSFRMSYEDPSDSNVHGKIFRPGQAPFLLLREELSSPGMENKVPRHNMGFPMQFCLVAEVRYTALCRLAFKDFYSHKNKGRMFDWPGGDAVETCPGTGEKVEPHSKKVRVLAAFQMRGFFMAGTTLQSLTRVIPRIITVEGLNRLLGDTPQGSPNRLACYSGPGGRPGCEEMQEIYPDLLRRFAGQKPNKEPKRPPSANDAWEAFHESGRYCAYEKFVETNFSATL